MLAVFRSFPFRASAASAGNGNGDGGSLVEETQAPPLAYNTLAREPEEAGEVIAEQADPENVGENGGVQTAAVSTFTCSRLCTAASRRQKCTDRPAVPEGVLSTRTCIRLLLWGLWSLAVCVVMDCCLCCTLIVPDRSIFAVFPVGIGRCVYSRLRVAQDDANFIRSIYSVLSHSRGQFFIIGLCCIFTIFLPCYNPSESRGCPAWP